MTSKLKLDITHLDVLGRELKLNDFVAYPSSSGLGRNQLKIGQIVALTPKMIKVVHLIQRSVYETKTTTRYPNDCILIDQSSITLYILKLPNL
jgi:poly(3-hydroxyalkanoate) synthetase